MALDYRKIQWTEWVEIFKEIVTPYLNPIPQIDHVDYASNTSGIAFNYANKQVWACSPLSVELAYNQLYSSTPQPTLQMPNIQQATQYLLNQKQIQYGDTVLSIQDCCPVDWIVTLSNGGCLIEKTSYRTWLNSTSTIRSSPPSPTSWTDLSMSDVYKPIPIAYQTSKVSRPCTCNSKDLFNFGCKCGGR